MFAGQVTAFKISRMNWWGLLGRLGFCGISGYLFQERTAAASQPGHCDCHHRREVEVS